MTNRGLDTLLLNADSPEEFAKALDDIRQGLGWSFETLAREAGLSQGSVVHRIIRGERDPARTTAKKLVDAVTRGLKQRPTNV